MIIGGLQRFSLLDYPGFLSAIIFTKNCNYRCQFCYNPMLVWPRVKKLKQKDHHSVIREDDLFAFLKKRQGKLDAVVITGGEPTVHANLPAFIAKIKKLGYLIKLDTNGSNPEMIQELIKKKLIDYIAMDIKAPADKYEKVAGKKIDFKKIQKSVKIIMKAKLPYEFRTTVVPGLLNKNDIMKIAKIIKGADKWYLQQFKGNISLINKNIEKVKPYSAKILTEMRDRAKKYIKQCEIR